LSGERQDLGRPKAVNVAEPPRASGPIRKGVFGQEKACFPGREQAETEVGVGFRKRGGVDQAPPGSQKFFIEIYLREKAIV
jgi:hypothetical protein